MITRFFVVIIFYILSIYIGEYFVDLRIDPGSETLTILLFVMVSLDTNAVKCTLLM